MEKFRISHVAKDKNVSRATVHQWVKKGKVNWVDERGIKILNDEKLRKIEPQNNFQHELKICRAQIDELKVKLEEKDLKIKSLEGRIAAIEESIKPIEKKSKTERTKVKTEKKRTKDKTKGSSNLIKKINKAIKQGISKRKIDPMTSGSSVSRILKGTKPTEEVQERITKNLEKLMEKEK